MSIGCSPAPCTTCPYRCDVPSGVWAAEEYEKLPPYDRPTTEQPAGLFMCHTTQVSFCTGWLQSHANREHAFDLLALRLNHRKLDCEAVSKVASMTPLVRLFRTGADAARHGMKAILRPGRKAKAAIERITRRRNRIKGKQ